MSTTITASTGERVEIPYSKTKLVVALVGALLFVGVGIAFLAHPDEFAQTGSRHKPVAFVIGLGLAAVLFFGTAAVFFLVRLFDKKPGLVIDDAGILINAASGVYISWADVTGTGVVKIKSTRILMLYLADPEGYINAQPTFIKRKLALFSHKSYNSPVGLSSSALKCNFDELTTLIESKLNR